MDCPLDNLTPILEDACDLRFVFEKLSVLATAKTVIQSDRFAEDYLLPLYRCDSASALLDWLAESITDPVATVLKYLLINGFYKTHVTDLRAYGLRLLSENRLYLLQGAHAA